MPKKDKDNQMPKKDDQIPKKDNEKKGFVK